MADFDTCLMQSEDLAGRPQCAWTLSLRGDIRSLLLAGRRSIAR